MSFWRSEDFERLVLEKVPILDVRAPVEFAEGHLPGSVNLPILNDEERAAVGTAYKQKGQEAAIALGHSLVSGAVKEERLAAWQDWLARHPEAVITCFRGGMRSGLTQQWLEERGAKHLRLQGGYKALRRFFLKQLETLAAHPWIVVAGATGAGKSALLQDLSLPRIDLERLANHRGSAFGALPGAQPAQATFENALGAELTFLANEAAHVPWLMEDESRMVGSCVLPETIYLALRSSPVVLIEESLESRVELTFAEYVLATDLSGAKGEAAADAKLADYKKAVRNISKKLGGLRTQEILASMGQAQALADHKGWIRKLIEEYYDPLYFASLARRQPGVLFRGSRAEVKDFLTGNRDARRTV